MLVPIETPGLYDGVSQQAVTARFPTQCEFKENCMDTVVSGTGKRPATIHLAQVSQTPFGSAFFHSINRDKSERYTVVLTKGNLQVFDAQTGEAKVVGFPQGKAYLNCQDAETDFAVVTIADYTFVVNKTVTVEMNPNDKTGGTYKGSVQAFRDLDDVRSPSTGDVYEIAGNETNSFDNYYVMREGGAWREAPKPGLLATFKASTMPHALVRQADGTFTFKTLEWERRSAGDEVMSPEPSFVHRKIQEVFFFRNRLGFLADDKVIMSRSGLFFNFWRESAMDLLDTDPIDVAVSGVQVTKLNFALPFEGTLMMFSEQAQFVLSAGDVLSPLTVSVDQVTAYESTPRVKPKAVGPSAFFATKSGAYTSIREYYTQENAVSNEAEDVTAHVPWYLPQDVEQIEASTNENMVFVKASSAPSRLYVYRFHWVDGKRAQSSWNYWTLPGDVLSMTCIDNFLYVLLEVGGAVYLNRMDLRGQLHTDGLGFDVLLDRRVTLKGTYEGPADETRFELPYPLREGDEPVVVLGSGYGPRMGEILKPKRIDPRVLTLPGNYSHPVHIGTTYRQVVELSELMYRKGNSVVQSGRLQIRTMTVSFINTGYFTVKTLRTNVVAQVLAVSPSFSAGTGRLVGSAGWDLGTPSISSGAVRVPVRGNSKHLRVVLENDSPLPSQLTRLEFEAEYEPRVRV